MVSFGRLHNKNHFSTILLPLLLLLLLYSLNYTIYLYTNSIYRGERKKDGPAGSIGGSSVRVICIKLFIKCSGE